MPETPDQDAKPSLGKTAQEIEFAMDDINMGAGGRKSEVEPMTFGERTRELFVSASPYWRKTAWWVMLVLSVIVVSLDINAQTDGALGCALMWLHTVVFRRCPSPAFIGGMVACYYVIFRGKRP